METEATAKSTAVELSALCSDLEAEITTGGPERLLSLDPHHPGNTTESVRRHLLETEQRLIRANFAVKRQLNICTPIGRLTDELIVEILRYCKSFVDDDLPKSSRKGIRIPYAYLLCSRWRAVATNASCLWSEISLPMPANLFALFLERSKQSSLRIKLSNTDMLSDKDPTIGATGNALRQVIPRVSQLHIDWDPMHTRGLGNFLVQYVGEAEFATLKTLHIRAHTTSWGRKEEIYTLNTPRLRDVVLTGPFQFAPLSPVESLTTLRWNTNGNTLSFTPLFKMLSHFPSIEQCDVIGHPLTSAVPSDIPNLSLKNLKRFSLSIIYLSQLRDTIGRLGCPDSLSISAKIYKADPAAVALADFLGPYMSTSDEFKIVKRDDQAVYTLISKTGREIEITHLDVIPFAWSDPAALKLTALNLPKLASYPSNLSHLHLQTDSLPSTQDLIRTLSAWALISSIRVQTDESNFGKLLTALENAPELICPLLKILDCTGTKVCSTRIAPFLAIRKRMGAPLDEFRIAADCVVVLEYSG